MFLSALALRLALVEALAPTGTPANGPWPTLAGALVLDSSFGPLDRTDNEARSVPVISVFTDGGAAEPYGSGKTLMVGGIDASIEVTFELSVLVADDAGGLAYGGTDAHAEATLDIMEAQIWARIRAAAISGALPRILKSIEKAGTVRFSDPDTAARLAARALTMTAGVKALDLAPVTNATGLDRLPNPLREVAKALPIGGYGRTICEKLAAAMFAQPAPETLETLNLDIALSGEGPPKTAPEFGATIIL